MSRSMLIMRKINFIVSIQLLDPCAAHYGQLVCAECCIFALSVHAFVVFLNMPMY